MVNVTLCFFKYFGGVGAGGFSWLFDQGGLHLFLVNDVWETIFSLNLSVSKSLSYTQYLRFHLHFLICGFLGNTMKQT